MKSAIIVGAALLCLLAAPPASAAEQQWVASRLRGTVLFLTDNQWQEVAVGQRFGSGAVVRTLQAGNLVLTKGGQRVSLEPRGALGFSSSASTLVPYDGAIELVASGPGPALTLVAPGATVSFTSGIVRGVVKDRTSVFTVVRGSANITDQRRHKTMQLKAGEIFNSQLGVTSSTPVPSGPSTSGASASASATAASSDANQIPNTGVPLGSSTDNGNGRNNGNHNGSDNGNSGGDGDGKGKSGK